MIPFAVVAALSLFYFGMLFAVAYYADQRSQAGRSLIDSPNVYSFSLAVYCTSWTFYGSVGRAATSGLDFLAIYLGPTLMAFTWWFLLRRMVRISKEQNIASIADFISSRYGKSAVLGAIVTAISPSFYMMAFGRLIFGIGAESMIVAITVAVYGAVALIVKADDAGAALARGRGGLLRAIGRGLVVGMPRFLSLLSLLGTLAMLWVGGGIVIHGLAEFGWHKPEDLIHDFAHTLAAATGPFEAALDWLLGAFASGLLGFGLGAAILGVLGLVRPAHAHG